MTATQQQDTAWGMAYALGTYISWGLMPLYFRALPAVGLWEVVAHRTLWSALLLGAVLGARGAWPDLVRCLRSPRLLAMLAASALLLGLNSLIYIYSVANGRVLQASLGYFINPLCSVLLGTLFLHERLRLAQWAALALAGVGLAYHIIALGELPWVALTLAGVFALYGLVRKQATADSLVALSVEMLILLPASLVFLGVAWHSGTAAFCQGNRVLDGLLLLSGVLTAVPLLLFGRAVRGLRLSTLGFLQYVSPGLQFVLALTVFGEPFQPAQAVGFACVWAALLLFSADALFAHWRASAPPRTLPGRDEPGARTETGLAQADRTPVRPLSSPRPLALSCPACADCGVR